MHNLLVIMICQTHPHFLTQSLSLSCSLANARRPFYGYHESEELFLRIYLVNPGLIKRSVAQQYIYIVILISASLL